ncbi:ADP-ribosylglycohydrolase family protein [Kibdelosporangium persicum]|uniref:ADP-ribosylglycohydrolase YegU n=1 Tax=Kibdelosporangium persicum TaxID=2698649 RepID=A0ABX2EVE9_9PSEU|nr:ADP-ribosylglycohydrolase family protein [Kibdelosporangium persicum]NRN62937.1 ADP-ribosylglycohydrolase YegU [Kibdelosporangium persicum]
MPEQVRARALGAFYGLALGDALGMPTQSMSRARIKDRYGSITGLVDAAPDQPIAPGMPAGSVTDDTEQAVLVAKLLVEGRGRIDPHAFAGALRAWEADMIARGSRDLLGPSTKRALELLDAGLDPQQAGVTGATNGAAMRVTPVGIANPVGDRLLDAVAQASMVTHNTSLGIAAASAIAAAISASLDGADLGAALDEAERAADQGARRGKWVPGGEIGPRIRWARQWVRGMSRDNVADAVAEVIGTSVAAQESVVAAIALVEVLEHDALTVAAQIGGDTDTVGAMTGAILGAQHGLAGLPADQVGKVREVNRLELEPLVDELLALR